MCIFWDALKKLKSREGNRLTEFFLSTHLNMRGDRDYLFTAELLVGAHNPQHERVCNAFDYFR